MDFLFGKSYNQKSSFDAGLTKVFGYIVNNVLPEYEEQQDLRPKLLVIKRFYADLTDSENVTKISENAIATLEIIKQDVLSYISMVSNKYGGEDISVLNPIPQSMLVQETARSADISSTINSTLPTDLSNNFIDYFNKYVNKFESIKLDNEIVRRSTALRPPLFHDLVVDLLTQYESKNPNPEKIKLTTNSIIEWYLTHNNVRGIELDSYDALLMKLSTDSDEHKHFIYRINSYLVPGSDGWGKAHS
jgi:hypothetical protein